MLQRISKVGITIKSCGVILFFLMQFHFFESHGRRMNGAILDLTNWLISPNGTEIYGIGSTLIIKIDGSVYDPNTAATVVELYKGSTRVGGPSYGGVTNRTLSTSGLPSGSDYKIRIYNYSDPTKEDWSNAFFSITSDGPVSGTCAAPVVSNIVGCSSGAQVVLRASTTASEIPNICTSTVSHKWYTSQYGSSYITSTLESTGTCAAYVTKVTVTSPTSYWVSTIVSGCESVRSKVTAIYINSGDVTIQEKNLTISRCSGLGSTQFNANIGSQSFLWEITPAAGTITAQGADRSSAIVSWNETYSGTAIVKITGSGCGSNQVGSTLSFTVNPLPTFPGISSLEFCDFEPIKLSLPSSATIISYKWYEPGATFIGQGLGVTHIVKPMGSYTYTVEAISSYGCISSTKASIPVSVISACDGRLNWIESIAYDNVGMVGNSKSYFDLTGRLLQTQSKNITVNFLQPFRSILTSQSIKDQYGRDVVGTLVAPTNNPYFQYKHWFVTDQSNGLYNYKDLNQPFGNSAPGTVGWYYSTNNTFEDHVPATAYPYSQMEYYTDGSGEARKSAGPGEVHRMGMGHDALSGTFPVFGELNDYLAKRTVALPGIGQDGSLVNEGVQSVTRDQNGKRGANENFSIGITDKEGKVVMSARSGTATDNSLAILNTVTATVVDPTSANYRPMVYFYLLTPQAVTITTNGTTTYSIENIVTGQVFTPSGTWPVGFYRVLVTAGEVTIKYTNYYLDVAYQFYDDAGRLRSSVSPNGFKSWFSNNDYPLIDKTEYTYNHRGWLLSMKEPDSGTTNFLYRKDGKIRFSQNAQQLSDETANVTGKGRFSYTNYDNVGRPVESGEYKGTAMKFADVKTLVELDYQINYGVDRKDWVKTYYESAYTNALDFPTGAGSEWTSQSFLRGAVSWSENANMRSIYSYDELGHVKWMAQKSTFLDRTFVVRYEYDFLGNVLKVHNLAYQKVGSTVKLAEQFYHHYEYDLDKRLSKAYTSIDGTTLKLRATYVYYLHGPLKRIELGDQLQGIDFVYNIQGWLQSINHPHTNQDPGRDGSTGSHSVFKKDVFGMVLDYYQSDLSGVYAASSSGSVPNPSNIHHLPSSIQNAQAVHQPLIRFKPTDEEYAGSAFKQYSAENPQYKKMISEASKNSANR